MKPPARERVLLALEAGEDYKLATQLSAEADVRLMILYYMLSYFEKAEHVTTKWLVTPEGKVEKGYRLAK